jgi:hypothetical protein
MSSVNETTIEKSTNKTQRTAMVDKPQSELRGGAMNHSSGNAIRRFSFILTLTTARYSSSLSRTVEYSSVTISDGAS